MIFQSSDFKKPPILWCGTKLLFYVTKMMISDLRLIQQLNYDLMFDFQLFILR